jgi:hypothetical protein
LELLKRTRSSTIVPEPYTLGWAPDLEIVPELGEYQFNLSFGRLAVFICLIRPCYDYEYHLENDISLAQYQYYTGTQNTTWLKEKGWPVISKIAEFWASQVVLNQTTSSFSTLNETDPGMC